jgi:glycogen synthase
MRILEVIQACYPFQDRGGPAIKAHSIAQALVEQGHNVTVLTADLGVGPAEIASAVAHRNGQGWRSDLGGVEAICLATRGRYRNLTGPPAW